MSKRIRRHLTFANIASAIALFVAIGGGTAVALSGSNVVDDNDPQDNIIESADVDPDALKGADINEGTLSGVNADQLDGKGAAAFGSGIMGGRMVVLDSGSTTDDIRHPIGVDLTGVGGARAPVGFLARDLTVTLSNFPGTGNSWTFTFRVAGAPTDLSCTITGSAVSTCTDSSDAVTVSAGDVYSFEVTSSGNPPNTSASFGWRAIAP